MAEQKEALSHNDMWDDSLLVDSWNQALEEYKVSEETHRALPPRRLIRAVLQKYHSIHAKGIPLHEIASE